MGTLYVIATPIGNLEDVTLRALRVLAEADLVLAEDTRRTRILLDHHGVAARPRSLHAHNEAARSEEALARLAGGARVALVSDAGTPLVSDPGARLVAAAAAAGHDVVPVPGASAVLAALAASGLAGDAFCFAGFLPRKAGARRARLAALRERPEPLVLFESPRRLAATLADLAGALGGERRACVARELTKRHEELVRGSLDELRERFAEGTRGEVTLVVAGAPPPLGLGGEALDARIRALLDAGESPRAVADALASEAGVPRREVYQRALALRGAR
jgi:16S rRNA (cytidine1402-2'-O)-methyltransferase